MPLPSWLLNRDPRGYDEAKRMQICGNDVELFRYGREWILLINGMEEEATFINEAAAGAAARKWCEANPYPDDD
jgi:hypothetical protein